METYTETVYSFRILRHEELPEEHKEAYRADGIDPDEIWSLYASFITKRDANRELKNLRANAAWFQTYKVVDGGEETTIERLLY